MAQGSLRVRFARRVDRAQPPPTYVLSDFSVTPPAPKLITFSALETQSQHRVPSIIPPLLILFTTNIPTPGVVLLTSDGIGEAALDHDIPPIETIFEPIPRPRIGGKAYKDDGDLGGDSVAAASPAINRDPVDLTVKCRHGLPTAFCEFCRQAVQRTKQTRRQTVDVFEQLRYILQPPILERIGQPDVFPNGRKPYDFQIYGIKWLLEHPQALLADEMGLGKTIQAIVAMRVLYRRGAVQHTLVVCPVSVASTWSREMRDWAPELRATRVKGSLPVRREQWKAPADIHLVSYETLARDIGELPSRVFDLCIIDEAQKIKNPSADRARAVKKLHAKYRWALTGTPLENRPEDTVSIFDFVEPRLFAGQEIVSPSRLRHKIAPYLLRRIKEDVLDDLPALVHLERWLEFAEAQRDAYDRAEMEGVEGLRELGAGATRVHIFSLISKLKQICNYDEYSGESCKLEFLREQLEKIVENGEKALVFSQYPTVTLRKIMPQLKVFSPLLYDGSLSERQRNIIVDQFQAQDTNQVLLMGVRSGGLGLTLTRANHVFHFDHWWNPAVIDQATARAHRISQQRDVFTTSFYTVDTIEQRIATLLQNKRDLFRDVFGELVDDEGTKLTDEDLFGLFHLPMPGKTDDRSSEKLSPTEFEVQIQRLFTRLGFKLSVTKKTRDGGVDLEGVKLDLGGGRVVVQCKRYSGTVPVKELRDLLGVVSNDNSIVQGFLVTTGRFSSDAQDFSRGQRLVLIDGTQLEMLLHQHLGE